MKVTGFSFIRNAVKYDYPIVEAITSILPICDDFILAVGNSEDHTIELIEAIKSPKIKIIHTVWDDSLRKDGKVLALETNKAFDAIPNDSDWAFYIQGDEVVHEKYLPSIKEAMQAYKDHKEVDGLLFNYLHFYGSYKYIGDSRKWYRNEIRIIKNNKNIRSYKDAQGFRFSDNTKLKVKPIDAFIYHYGWVKEPDKQQEKQKTFHMHWHDDDWMSKNIPDVTEFDYSKVDSVKLFTGEHPKVMESRIRRLNWDLNLDTSKKNFSVRYRFLYFIEKITGWRIGEYKNYKKV